MNTPFPFNSREGLIVVSARIVGPSGQTLASLALDTGATSTMINTAKLVAIGYDPGLSTDRVRITTASGVEFSPKISVSRFESLSMVVNSFPVICHTLPPSATVDGLLGLDFLRDRVLTVDFRTGLLQLS